MCEWLVYHPHAYDTLGDQKEGVGCLGTGYRRLLGTMWMLGPDPYSSVRAASALNPGVISLVPLRGFNALFCIILVQATS